VHWSRRDWLCRIGLLLAGSLVSALGGQACSGFADRSPRRPLARGKPGGTMDFNAVETGDHSPSPCTPEVADDFIGIRINAPPKVVRGSDKFVICGTYRFAAEYMDKFPDIHNAVALVAVDGARHRPLACTLRPPGSDPPPTRNVPPAQPDPDWMREHYVQRYFNVDLLRLMPDLPQASTDYFIYALIEDHVSNVVRVSYRA
jgi:hypothetical protein